MCHLRRTRHAKCKESVNYATHNAIGCVVRRAGIRGGADEGGGSGRSSVLSSWKRGLREASNTGVGKEKFRVRVEGKTSGFRGMPRDSEEVGGILSGDVERGMSVNG